MFLESRMLFSATTEGSASNMVSQLLYELWILLLDLLGKLLSPVQNVYFLKQRSNGDCNYHVILKDE